MPHAEKEVPMVIQVQKGTPAIHEPRNLSLTNQDSVPRTARFVTAAARPRLGMQPPPDNLRRLWELTTSDLLGNTAVSLLDTLDVRSNLEFLSRKLGGLWRDFLACSATVVNCPPPWPGVHRSVINFAGLPALRKQALKMKNGKAMTS